MKIILAQQGQKSHGLDHLAIEWCARNDELRAPNMILTERFLPISFRSDDITGDSI